MKALNLPETGMAVTLDIATVMNIHPPFKKEVGERLAFLALNNDYGMKYPSVGPVYKSMSVAREWLNFSLIMLEKDWLQRITSLMNSKLQEKTVNITGLMQKL